MKERNVVITGVGAITPLGRTYEETMQRAWAGEIGITNERTWLEEQFKPEWLTAIHTKFDELSDELSGESKDKLLALKDSLPGYQRVRAHVTGRIKDYDLISDTDYPFSELIPARSIPREFSPAAILGLRAAAEAATKAGIADENLNPVGVADTLRYSIVIGTGIGGAILLPEGAYKLLRNVRPATTDLFKLQPENPAIVIADVLGAEGGHSIAPRACNSSNAGFAQAIRKIKNNEDDVVLAGGIESLSHYTLAEFEATGAAYEGTDPTRASLPFNPARQGAVITEGATFLVLEEEEHAKRRGANILAQMNGYGEAGGPGERTELSVRHLYHAVCLAMANSGWLPSKNTVYIPHATGTPKGDPGEIVVVQKVTQEMGANLRGRTAPSKGIFGHMLGGAGAIGAGMAVEMIQTQSLPPATGSEEVEDGMEEYITSAEGPTGMEVDCVINVGSGFGNQNGAVLIERYEH